VWNVIFSGRRGARFVAAAAVLALAAAGPATGAEGGAAPAGVTPEEIGAKVLDVAVLRPLGAIATVAGFAFFVASLPIAAPTLEIDTTWDVFVLAPADYTFVRPIGEF
jgi:hypothetical protein